MTSASRLLVAVVSLAACSAPPPGQPADAVRRFFGAVEAGDCEAAFAALSRAYRAEIEERHRCPESLTELRQISLEDVVDVQVDGRNSRAHLVRVHLRGRAAERAVSSSKSTAAGAAPTRI